MVRYACHDVVFTIGIIGYLYDHACAGLRLRLLEKKWLLLW